MKAAEHAVMWHFARGVFQDGSFNGDIALQTCQTLTGQAPYGNPAGRSICQQLGWQKVFCITWNLLMLQRY